MTRRWILGGLLGSIVLSAFLHVGAWGALYYALTRTAPPPIVAELDLTMAPLQVPNAGGGRAAKPAETWTAPKKAPAPAPKPVVQEAPKEAPKPKDEEPLPCPDPCKATGQGTGGGGGGSEGQYIPASQAARQPRWVSNFITSRDYPRVAQQEGKDGRVVLSLLLDAEGHVRDARLLQGSYEVLNEVALRKIRDAVFTPAYDASGRAAPCKVTLPIRFELR